MLLLSVAWATPTEDWENARNADDPTEAARWLESARSGFAKAQRPIEEGRVVLDQIRLAPERASTLWASIPNEPALAPEIEALKGDLAWARGEASTALEHWETEIGHLEPGPHRDERRRLLAWRHLADRPSDDLRALTNAMKAIDLPSPESLKSTLRGGEEIWVVQHDSNVPNWLGFISPHRTRWVRWDGTPSGAFHKLPDSSRVTTRWGLGDPLSLDAAVPLTPMGDPMSWMTRQPTPSTAEPAGSWLWSWLWSWMMIVLAVGSSILAALMIAYRRSW